MGDVNKGNSISEIYNLFMQAAVAVQKYADSKFYRESGISAVKFNVLQMLATSEDPVTPTKIARRIIRERHDVTTLVRRMQRDGLVDVVPSTTDKRSVNILLTNKGREKLTQAEPVEYETTKQIMAKMSKYQHGKLFYIHGYQSSPDGDKGILFREQLHAKAIKYRDCEPEDLLL